jgi:CRP/FNR family transcriptional regulator
MRLIQNESCETCRLKCDIYLTAREMNIENELKPVQIIYKKYETICRQNAGVSCASILVEGNAKMFIDGINRKNIILNILIPSNYIGLTSVFGSVGYSYNVAALNECKTCQVDIEMVKMMYYSNHNFLLKLNQAFGNSVSAILGKLISLNQKQLRGKVADSLLYLSHLYDSKKFALVLTRKELGELAAISEENAVRVLTEFKNEGIIDIRGKEIELIKYGILETISNVG